MTMGGSWAQWLFSDFIDYEFFVSSHLIIIFFKCLSGFWHLSKQRSAI